MGRSAVAAGGIRIRRGRGPRTVRVGVTSLALGRVCLPPPTLLLRCRPLCGIDNVPLAAARAGLLSSTAGRLSSRRRCGHICHGGAGAREGEQLLFVYVFFPLFPLRCRSCSLFDSTASAAPLRRRCTSCALRSQPPLENQEGAACRIRGPGRIPNARP